MMNEDKYSAVIIDDEEKLRASLALKLERFFPEIEILGEAGNADSGLELIRSKSPQLIFLDIRMPRGSGFDMLERLESLEDIEVIFVTGYNEFALQALKISAVDYLLKPVDDDDLKEAVMKAKERIDGKLKINDYDLLKHNITYQSDQRSKLTLPGQNSYDLVEISQIIRCEGEQRYTRLFLKDGGTFLSSYNIGRFREMLEGYDFFNVHKSHLVNMHHITKYLKEGALVMIDGSEVPISRRKRDEFKMAFNHFNENGLSGDD